MENISEALKMAAGMLIAVLLIMLLVYVFRSISGLENSKNDKIEQEQTSAFNQRFLAFDRSSMYGTDVISVIGLAISNNKIYNQSLHANPLGNYEENADYSMNIKFTLPNPIQRKTIVEHYKIPNDGKPDDTEIKSTETILEAGPYELKMDNVYDTSSRDYKTYKAIEDIALNGDEKSSVSVPKRVDSIRETVTITDTTGYLEFKSVIFECTAVRYNQVGRVYEMEFRPKN